MIVAQVVVEQVLVGLRYVQPPLENLDGFFRIPYLFVDDAEVQVDFFILRVLIQGFFQMGQRLPRFVVQKQLFSLLETG